MRGFYSDIFLCFYLWSAKLEVDSRPNLYRAVLYVSFFQFLNLVSLVFLIESLISKILSIGGWGFAVVIVVLIIANHAMVKVCFQYASELHEVLRVRCVNRRVLRKAIAYVSLTLLLFGVTFLLFVLQHWGQHQ
jgi:uncharacterized membrane protein